MGEEFRVIIMPEASSDLTGIFDYIENDSLQNAEAVLLKIFGAIDSLNHFPHRCKIHLSSRNPNRVIRSMVVPPFIAYYRVREVEKVVEVLTIRHGARRQPRKFKLRKS